MSFNYIIILYVVALMNLCLLPHGHAGHAVRERQPVRIGLLLPDQNSVSAKNGAELAIQKANQLAGPDDPYFKLVVRSMEGPWGAGANEAIQLIFEDKVCAIVCSVDGRNAHLAEQAATKSQVVLLSAWSGDPTLSQAFVPWFYNVAPNYIQQAAILTEEILHKQKIRHLTAVVDNQYDSKSALNFFISKFRESGAALSGQWTYTNRENELPELAEHLRKTNTEGLILFVKSRTALKIIDYLRQKNIRPAIFAPLFVFNENELSVKDYLIFENVVMISSEHWFNLKAQSFRDDFRNIYGHLPGNAAAYAYDAIQMLTTAIGKGGTSREKIQQALSKISCEGITGTFQYDSKGNRVGNISLVSIKNGLPVKTE